ncbi:FecR family protein [Sphingobacterium faecale]|uniref:FecR domain-containing protein n=1 Tax=Sphingobacterium faecale TaxID=2803775 RepID=A0ABS1R9Y8_9SPHI|nr:FecR family protein [Sphingobacterium faecale]MBL1411488.1 FecR domain-containing protein [Sphingobacterium faecale]
MEHKQILVLIAKLQQNTITADELKELKKIFSTSGDSKELMRLFRDTYETQLKQKDSLDIYERQHQVKNRLINSTAPANIPHRRKNNFYYWTACAIALILLIGGFFYSKQLSSSMDTLELIQVSTKAGERKKITLRDGSSILLNGNSSLYYPKLVTDDYRMVKLQGEAFFDVASDRQKPFIVIADDFTTQVVGTSFNIDTDNNRTIQVNTGKVNVFKVSDKSITQALKAHHLQISKLDKDIAAISTGSVTLIEGEKAKLNATGAWEVSPYSLRNWKDNELTYINEPMTKVVRNLYRNFGDSIRLDSSFMNKKITITLSNKNSIQVLNTLTELCNGKLILNKEKNIWQITEQ